MVIELDVVLVVSVVTELVVVVIEDVVVVVVVWAQPGKLPACREQRLVVEVGSWELEVGGGRWRKNWMCEAVGVGRVKRWKVVLHLAPPPPIQHRIQSAGKWCCSSRESEVYSSRSRAGEWGKHRR